MSIRSVQQGLMDTVQDAGRRGYQHLGINPGGVMDRIAMYVANSLVGNAVHEAVIELHFPASAFLFETDALIALSGADFGAVLNEQPFTIHRPVIVARHTVLRFTKPVAGARCYLAVRGGLALTPWLHSYSTHIKAGAGGYNGGPLRKNDRLPFREATDYSAALQQQPVRPLPWTVNIKDLYSDARQIRITAGSEWDLLKKQAQLRLTSGEFALTEKSDRMGFRLQGPPLLMTHRQELLSSGVTRGALQLLPSGQLIILMADHQTTGGYPRVAHVITADQPALSQLCPHQYIGFEMIGLETAQELLWQQEQRLLFVQNACKLQLEELLLHYGLH